MHETLNGRIVKNAPEVNSHQTFLCTYFLLFFPRIITWLEHAIQSNSQFQRKYASPCTRLLRDSSPRISCFDSCQVIETLISQYQMKDARCKQMLYASVDLLAGEWLPRREHRFRLRRAYVPASNTTSHDDHDESNSCVAIGMGLNNHVNGVKRNCNF